MAKSTGGFTDRMAYTIRQQIVAMAQRTNAYYAFAGVDRRLLLELLVHEDDREEAVSVVRKYGDYLSAAALQPTMTIPVIKVDDPHLAHIGGQALGFAFQMDTSSPGAFVTRRGSHVARDIATVAPELVTKLQEWCSNAARWAFVSYVFEWVNNFVDTGDKKHVRYLLPGIMGLLRMAGQGDLANNLMSVSARPHWAPPSVELRTELLVANQIIAEGMLYAPRTAPIPSENEARLTSCTIYDKVQFYPDKKALPEYRVTVLPIMNM